MMHQSLSLNLSICLLAGLWLLACSPQQESADRDTASAIAATASADNNGEPAMPGNSNKLPQHLQLWHEQARDDLALRLQINAGEIVLEQATNVTWSDGALGCPEPDMYYTQALVPGYRIVFSAFGGMHYYHGQNGKPPFYCPADRAGQPLPDSPESLT